MSFVIDNTNPLPGDRAAIWTGPASRVSRCRLFFRDCLARRCSAQQRAAGKAESAGAGYRRNISETASSYNGEGFDAIYKVTISPEGAFIVSEAPDQAVAVGKIGRDGLTLTF